ncbi:MAG: nuclear transport factor 2 family protein [Deltaproteobacteria bacterium]|nr:nuclear transport factor 2 family protein [Deltaproteobacteria bacterium]
MTITAEHIRAVFARYCELVSQGDVEAIAQLYAEDATVEDPLGSPPHRGRAAIRAFYRAAAGAVRLELEGRVRSAGNQGAAAMIARPNADPRTRVETLDVMTFGDDGLITSMRAYWSADTIYRD